MVGVLTRGGKVLDDLAGMGYQVAELARGIADYLVGLGCGEVRLAWGRVRTCPWGGACWDIASL